MSKGSKAMGEKEIKGSILWRGFFLPGHEACQLFLQNSRWHLEGAAAFVHEGLPCRLDYHIISDDHWRSLLAEVNGWLGEKTIDITLTVTSEHTWQVNGADQPNLNACTDVDLNFSPSTNLLPIRRLNLAIGEAAEVKAAWLRFPGFQVEPLEQKYTRMGEFVYRYENAGGKFISNLKVNATGFVVEYPDLWKSEATYENPSEGR